MVAGSGIAGLSLAAALTERGKSILVVEKSSTLGGSTRMSGGTVWTAASMEAMCRYVPAGDREKQRHLIDGIDEGLAWLRFRGVEVGERRETTEKVGAQVDPVSLVARLVTHVTAHGGAVAAQTALEGVETDATGAVMAAVLGCGDERWTVRTEAVVLATGGFQGSEQLLSRYVPGHT